MTRTFTTHFDDLHTMDAVYGTMDFRADLTVIEIRSGLEFMDEHPGYAIYGRHCPKARIIFNKVRSYKLTRCPYLKSPEEGGFGPTQEESGQWHGEGPFIEFYLEGVKLDPPPAWLSLELQAQSFELQVLD